MHFGKQLVLLLIGIPTGLLSQNLPSLTLDKNINATFSIIGYDAEAKEWGVAVATNNLYVGNSTIYIRPGIGAFSVIAETEPMYGTNGLELLQKGHTIKEAIETTKDKDKEAHFRQVSGIDANGNGHAFTGAALHYWKGAAATKKGKNYVVMGNQLAEGVLSAMATRFENSKGTLAQRLLQSLLAGQEKGGQLSGKQSAALVVKGSENEWFNQIDLRVDHSKTPFKDLEKLLQYHYGRIRVNQTLYAARQGNIKRAKTVLAEAEKLTDGWTGIYGKLILAHSLLGNTEKAVALIQKALTENPNWSSNLSAFYYLRHHEKINPLITPETFTLNDWNSAIMAMIVLQKHTESVQLAEKTLEKHPYSSYTHYLLGKAFVHSGQHKKGRLQLKKAIQLDADNREAIALLNELHD